MTKGSSLVKLFLVIFIALASFNAPVYAQLDPEFDENEPDDVWDPIEPVNRGIFWFNDKADTYVIEPVAKGYDYILPDPVQGSISNFFKNLSWPSQVVDDLVALDFSALGLHTGRFLVNSTVGVLGLFDVATDLGLTPEEVDLGLVLGRYGIDGGPFLVVPFLGPSNLRDLFGTTVDGYADPLTLITFTNLKSSEKSWIFFGGNGLRLLNRRAALLDAVDTAKKGSLDYYSFIKNAYNQRREGLILSKDSPSSESPTSESLLTDSEEFLPEE